MRPFLQLCVLISLLAWDSSGAFASDGPSVDSSSRIEPQGMPYWRLPQADWASIANRSQVPTEASDENSRERTFFLFVSTGFLECAGFGLGAQVTRGLAVAVKTSGAFVSGTGFLGPPGAWGIGMRTIIAVPDLVLLQKLIHFNAVRVEASYLFRVYNEHAQNKGIALEATAGYENFAQSGASFFWSCGIALSAAEGIAPLIFPAVKVGITWSF